MLAKHRLLFHKKSHDDSGKADAYFTGQDDDCVWGVVFELDPAEKPALDVAEGLGTDYLEKTVCVAGPSGNVEATMYYAKETHPGLRPYSWYLRFVVDGARQHELPSEYVSSLERVQSIADPDANSDAQHRAIRC